MALLACPCGRILPTHYIVSPLVLLLIWNMAKTLLFAFTFDGSDCMTSGDLHSLYTVYCASPTLLAIYLLVPS
jgi:hypothetical protein